MLRKIVAKDEVIGKFTWELPSDLQKALDFLSSPPLRSKKKSKKETIAFLKEQMRTPLVVQIGAIVFAVEAGVRSRNIKFTADEFRDFAAHSQMLLRRVRKYASSFPNL
jgi:hypothetical protein